MLLAGNAKRTSLPFFVLFDEPEARSVDFQASTVFRFMGVSRS